MLQVNSLDELYDDVPDESEDHLDIVVIVLLSTIVASTLGCVTTILLIIGVSRKSSLLFLPWLVWHMLEILGSVASGSGDTTQISLSGLSFTLRVTELIKLN